MFSHSDSDSHGHSHGLLAVVFLGALLILDGGSVAAQAPSGGRSAVDSAAPTRLRAAFGYEIGEERRYVLEPARSLRPGESAWWSIVLDDIQGEGDEPRIIFGLEHERVAARTGDHERAIEPGIARADDHDVHFLGERLFEGLRPGHRLPPEGRFFEVRGENILIHCRSLGPLPILTAPAHSLSPPS